MQFWRSMGWQVGLLVMVGQGATATDFAWNTALGNWTDSSNWTPQGVPGPGDRVTIANGGIVNVTTPISIQAMTLGGAQSGEMLLQHTLTSGGVVLVSNGILRLDGSLRPVTLSLHFGSVLENGGFLQVNNSANHVFITSGGGATLSGNFPSLTGQFLGVAAMRIVPNVTVHSGESLSLEGPVTVGNLTVESGGQFFQGVSDLVVLGSFSAAGAYDKGSGSMYLAGRGPQTLLPGGNILGAVTITGSGTAVTVGNSGAIGNLTVMSGASLIQAASVMLTCRGGVTLVSGAAWVKDPTGAALVVAEGSLNLWNFQGQEVGRVNVRGAGTALTLEGLLTCGDLEISAGSRLALAVNTTLRSMGHLTLAPGGWGYDVGSRLVFAGGAVQMVKTQGTPLGTVNLTGIGTIVRPVDPLTVGPLTVGTGAVLEQGVGLGMTLASHVFFQGGTFTQENSQPVVCQSSGRMTLDLGGNQWGSIVVTGATTELAITGRGTLNHLTLRGVAVFQEQAGLAWTLLGQLDTSEGWYQGGSPSSSTLILAGGVLQTLNVGSDDTFSRVVLSGSGTVVVPLQTWNVAVVDVGVGSELLLAAHQGPLSLGMAAAGSMVNAGTVRVTGTGGHYVTLFSTSRATLSGQPWVMSGHTLHVSNVVWLTSLTLSDASIVMEGPMGANSLTVLSGGRLIQGQGATLTVAEIFRVEPGVWEGSREAETVFDGGSGEVWVSGGYTLGVVRVRGASTAILAARSMTCLTLIVESGRWIQYPGAALRIGARLSLAPGSYVKEVDGVRLTLSGPNVSLWAEGNDLGRLVVADSGTRVWAMTSCTLDSLKVNSGALLVQGSAVTLNVKNELEMVDGGFQADVGRTGRWIFGRGGLMVFLPGANTLGNVRWTSSGTALTVTSPLKIREALVDAGVSVWFNPEGGATSILFEAGGSLVNNGSLGLMGDPASFSIIGSNATWTGQTIRQGQGLIRVSGFSDMPKWDLPAGMTLWMETGGRLAGMEMETGDQFTLASGLAVTLTGSWVVQTGPVSVAGATRLVCEGGQQITLRLPGATFAALVVQGNTGVTAAASLSVNALSLRTGTTWRMGDGVTLTVINVLDAAEGSWVSSSSATDEIVGGGTLTLAAAGNDLGRFRAAAGSIVRIVESLSLDGLVVEVSGEVVMTGSSLTLAGDPASTWVIDGILRVTGGPGQEIRWQSRVPGSRMRVAARRDQIVAAYVRFQDLDASIRSELWNATTGGLDGGNNLSINFDETPPGPVGQLQGRLGLLEGSLELLWTAPGDDGAVGQAVSYVVRISRNAITDEAALAAASLYFQTWTPAPAGQIETRLLTGLEGNVTYYVSIQARDDAGNLAGFLLASVVAATTQKDVTPPAAIVDLAATSGRRAGSIDLKWRAPGDDGSVGQAAGYLAQISTALNMANASLYVQAWIPAPSGTSEAVTLTGLAPGTTYYLTVRAYDDGNPVNVASVSSIVSAVARVDTLAPQEPLGLQLSGRQLRWGAVRTNADGTPMDDFGEFRVYRARSLEGSYELAGVTSAVSRFYEIPDALTEWYFTIRAVDETGNESRNSGVIRPQAGAKWVWQSADTRSEVRWPQEVAQYLIDQSVSLGKTLGLRIAPGVRPASSKIVDAFELQVVTEEGASSGIHVFPKPLEVVVSLGGSAGVPKRAPALEPGDWSVFWWDGVAWIKVGGEVDLVTGHMALKTARAGQYRVGRSQRATGFAITQVAPRKIFTPNGDGVGDTFTVFYDNPADRVIATAKIYDVNGAEVAEFQRGDFDQTLRWDGKDRWGQSVASGVYLYLIEAEGQVHHGTVVVAR